MKENKCDNWPLPDEGEANDGTGKERIHEGARIKVRFWEKMEP